jgi:Ca2+-binding EF-hand superfamily protein
MARPNTVAGPSQTQAAYEVKHKDDPQLQNLKELRKTCGLKNVPVGDALQSLKSMSSDGKLTREQFLGAYTLLLQKFDIEVPSDDVKNAVFDLFDRDDNGVVDMMELICGASLLCTGTEEDKIHAVFDVFDENGDGVISMDEMFKFLTSVFKVVLTPNVMSVMNSMGVAVESPEDLASVTALECFKTADLNHDGRLSVQEFKSWFFAPRNDPSFLFSPVRKLLQ